MRGSIVNNEVVQTDDELFLYVDGDEKYVYVINDDYTFKLVGSDEGKMDYDVTTYVDGEVERVIEYKDVPLKNNVAYYSYVPENVYSANLLYDLVAEEGDELSADLDSYEGAHQIFTESISLNNENLKLNVGDKKTLSATVLPTNTTNGLLNWTSSDDKIATVNEVTGEVEAIAKGTATVTVTTLDGFQAQCAVEVTLEGENSESETPKPTNEPNDTVSPKPTDESNVTASPKPTENSNATGSPTYPSPTTARDVSLPFNLSYMSFIFIYTSVSFHIFAQAIPAYRHAVLAERQFPATAAHPSCLPCRSPRNDSIVPHRPCDHCTGTHKRIFSYFHAAYHSGIGPDSGAPSDNGSLIASPPRRGTPGILHIGEHARRTKKHVILAYDTGIYRYIVLYLHIVPKPYARSHHHVLPQIARLSKHGTGHYMRKMPDMATRPYYRSFIDNCRRMYENFFHEFLFSCKITSYHPYYLILLRS